MPVDTFDERLRATYLPKLAAFQKALNFQGGIVYYPLCSDDTSPSQAFPNSMVVYADTDIRAVKKLQESGHAAYGYDATKFKLRNPADILILLRAEIDLSTPLSQVKEGGYVICHDWKGNATELRGKRDFDFVALIHPGKNGEYVYDTSDLEDCWKEMDDDEDLRAFSRSGLTNWKLRADYWDVVSTVRWITGKRENYLEEYKKILEGARERTIEGLEIIDDSSPWMEIEWKGESHTLFIDFPHKKGIIDDFYVFRKKIHEQT